MDCPKCGKVMTPDWEIDCMTGVKYQVGVSCRDCDVSISNRITKKMIDQVIEGMGKNEG